MNRMSAPVARPWPSRFPDPALLSSELRECQAVVANVFGYHALQLTAWPDGPDLLSTAQTISRHSAWVTPDGRVEGCFRGRLYELPLASESNALVVLHHVHELQGSGYGVLSELHRILKPEGIAVLIGVNPWRRGARWRALELKPVRAGRLVERLKGFDLHPLMVRPIGHERSRVVRWLARLSRRSGGMAWLGNLGQGYIVVARKKRQSVPILRLRQLGLSGLKGRVSTSSVLAERCGE